MFKKWLEQNSVSDHPLDRRLFEKASNRAYWDRFLSQTQIRDAEQYLGFRWPLIRASHFMAYQRTGDRLIQEDPHFARRRALLALFLGELAEYKGRFLPDLCDGIFAICEETFWGLSAHYPITREGDLLPSAADPYIDLFAAETAELLSVIYHILYDELRAFCPQLIDRMEYELERRILTPYCNRGDFWWMGNTPKKPNNWTPWILQNILTVFVTVPVTPTRLAFALQKMLTEMERYYEILPADGGCDEGASYWAKAGAKLFNFCDVLYIVSGGRIDLFHDEKLKQIGLFEARAHIGGSSFVNFSDGSNIVCYPDMEYPLYGFGIRTGEESLCRFAAALKKAQTAVTDPPIRDSASIKESLFSLICAQAIDAQPPYVPQEVCILPDLQAAYLRENAWYAAIKGGNNEEAHNHNDVGSFLVYYENAPVLVDPGIGTYTKQTFTPLLRYELPGTQSAYHNLPLINGVMQQNGPEFRADRFEAEGKTVTVSFAKAYPESAGVTEAIRTLRLHPDGVDITDSFAFSGEDRFMEYFMTPLSVTPEGDTALIGGNFALTVKGASVSVDRMDFDGDKKYIRSWGCEGLNRIRFAMTGPRAEITLRKLK